MNNEANTHLDKAIEIIKTFLQVDAKYKIPKVYINDFNKVNEIKHVFEDPLKIKDEDIKIIKDDFWYSKSVSTTCKKQEIEFYYHINKSLLNAEYLFLEDYSKRLERTIYIEDQIEILIEDKDKNPRFIRDFYILNSSLKALCWRIKNAIDEKNTKRVELETHPKEFANKVTQKFNIDDNLTDNSEALFLFTQSVIDMTAIDHIFKATSDNIGKLTALWHRIEYVEKNITDDDFKTIIEIVKAKTATLLYKLVYDIDDKDLNGLNDVKLFFSTEKETEEQLKEKIYQYKIKESINPTINIKQNNRNKVITCKNLPSSISQSKLFYCEDIKNYNNWINKGQKCYCEKSNLINTITESKNGSPDKIKMAIDGISMFYDTTPKLEAFSPYYFFLVLDFIKTQINQIGGINDTNNEKYNNLLVLLQQTLHYIKQYINRFENSIPPVFRPYFENSFYKFDKSQKSISYFLKETDSAELKWRFFTSYDCEIFKDSFFFASYYCNAISINRLREKYEEYILFFNARSSLIIQGISDFKTNQLKKTIVQTEQLVEKQKEELEKSRHSSLQILGLFTAFLSFIVTSIGTFRVANNITEYIIYSLTYTLAIALFAFLISDKDESKNKYVLIPTIKKQNKNSFLKKRIINIINSIKNNKKTVAFITTFLILLVFSACYFLKHSHNEININTSDGVTISIDNYNSTSTMDINNGNTLSSPTDTISSSQKHINP